MAHTQARQGTTTRRTLITRLSFVRLQCLRCQRRWWARNIERPYTQRAPRPCPNCGPSSGWDRP